MKDLPLTIFALVLLSFAIQGSRDAVHRFAAALKEYAPDAFRQFNNPSLTIAQNQRNLRTYIHSREYERLGFPLVTQLGRRAAYTHAAMFVFAFTAIPYLATMFLVFLFHLK